MADHDFPSPSHDPTFPDWQREFQTALPEVEPPKVAERVQAAEAAIFRRQQALAQSLNGHVERQAIEDAMRALRVIQMEKLKYPDWNKR
jgi:hypothetical protein